MLKIASLRGTGVSGFRNVVVCVLSIVVSISGGPNDVVLSANVTPFGCGLCGGLWLNGPEVLVCCCLLGCMPCCLLKGLE